MILEKSRMNNLIKNRELRGLPGEKISQLYCNFIKNGLAYFTKRYHDDCISLPYLNFKNQKFLQDSLLHSFIRVRNKETIDFRNVSFTEGFLITNDTFNLNYGRDKIFEKTVVDKI